MVQNFIKILVNYLTSLLERRERERERERERKLSLLKSHLNYRSNIGIPENRSCFYWAISPKLAP